MTAPERIAVVTPRRDRRAHAERWSRLLAGRAETLLCESPADAEARGADLVVVDADCPDLQDWIRRETEEGRTPESIVVFGDRGAPVAWGPEGTDVLAAISDYLDRRELLRGADEFLEELRESNERLEHHRRRFARLAAEQAEALRGANRSLEREVEELTRLQELARLFTRPARRDGGFAHRAAEVAGRVLGADGAALCRGTGSERTVEGRWKISARNALGVAAGQASARKGLAGRWLAIDGAPAPGWGLALLMREGREPGGDGGPAFLGSVQSILAEGLATRASTEAMLARRSQSDRILQTLRGGLLKIDRAGRVALANPACAEILETTVPELEGRSVEEIFPPRAREILEALPSDGRLDDVETYVVTARGRHVSVSVRASALPGDAGEGTLVLISDLSRRKEVEEEVRRVDRLASLGRLSAGVAHEVRNPLAGIRTTAEILRRRLDDGDERARFVDVILEETARLDRIVGSLLQFAKPPEPRPEMVDVPGLLRRAARLAAGRAADRRVDVRVTEPAGLPSLRADRDQMLQVVLNLLLNAIEATPEGGEVRVSAEIGGREGRLRLVVEDEGSGVPAAVRERIFDPFFTTKAGGTGLGLSISQGIVARHGGSLRVEETGTGTRAVVSLPTARVPEERGNPWQTS